MPIKASSVGQIEALAADLGSDRAVTREAAAARLTVLGPRAVDRLLTLVGSDSAPVARALALRTLEAIGDPRALDAVLNAIDASDAAVASAAVSAARAFLRSQRGALVVDRLTAVVMDQTRDDGRRIAALEALRDLEASTLAPLLKALEHDPNEAIQRVAAGAPSGTPSQRLVEATERGLPDSAAELVEALNTGGGATPLPVLLRIIERVREREDSLPTVQRPEWTRVRGRVHVELAKRGSRLALYDLREALETATSPLPVDFLAGLSMIGDAPCLEAVAKAYERAAKSVARGDTWWRDHLADAFRTIVAREGVTRRHGAIKKIEKRMKNTVDELWPQ